MTGLVLVGMDSYRMKGGGFPLLFDVEDHGLGSRVGLYSR